MLSCMVYSGYVPRRASKTAAINTRARDREHRAFELRKAGATYQQIGSQLGVTKQAANKMIKRVLAELKDLTDGDAEDVRRIEVERLDVMTLALWPKARRGDVQEVDRVLRIMQRRAELLGLDSGIAVTANKVGTSCQHVVEVVFVGKPSDTHQG